MGVGRSKGLNSILDPPPTLFWKLLGRRQKCTKNQKTKPPPTLNTRKFMFQIVSPLAEKISFHTECF